MDVSQLVSVKEASQRYGENYQRLDVLINNAGILLDQGTGILTQKDEIVAQTIQTNLLSSYYVTKYFLPFMKKIIIAELLKFLPRWGN